MAKAKKEKQPKERQYKFYGFNITVQQSNGLTPRPIVYEALVHDAWSSTQIVNVGGERVLFFRTGWKAKVEYNGRKERLFGGSLTRCTEIKNTTWINRISRKYETINIPDGVYPNVFEADYILVPGAHRLFVKTTSKIAPIAILKFLRTALNEVATTNQTVNVSIITSKDAFEEILAAPVLDLLKVNITYTNDDLGKKAKKDIDKMLKKAHIGNLDSTLRPDATGSIDTNSPYVQGVLGLAKENGSAEATFHDKHGKRKKIKTVQYPEKIIIKSRDPENIHINILEYVMNRWRKQNARRNQE